MQRNLSNQSNVVLVAVPLNVSGKFTCEISVEAPSFQTAMVSGEMEVVGKLRLIFLPLSPIKIEHFELKLYNLIKTEQEIKANAVGGRKY